MDSYQYDDKYQHGIHLLEYKILNGIILTFEFFSVLPMCVGDNNKYTDASSTISGSSAYIMCYYFTKFCPHVMV